jgi:ribokinase
MKKAVFGSMNIDKVCVVDRIPQIGETIKASAYFESFGGKGANQAVAIAKLSAKVSMIGCVGVDGYGDKIITYMNDLGIDMSGVKALDDAVTGSAFIYIGENDNTIVIVGGANDQVNTLYLNQVEAVIEEADVLLLQNEIPKTTVEYVLNTYGERKTIIYNPAPYFTIDTKALIKATWITPNESEAELMKMNLGDHDIDKQLIITKGSEGVTYYENGELKQLAASTCTVKDTTGAGDTFNGALAYALSKDWSISEAVSFANTAAGISTERIGAQGGMPNIEQVMERMKQ